MKYPFNIVKYLIALCIIFYSFNTKASALETAPRISDREIIESLASIKQEIININKRFDNINKRIDDLSINFNERFNSLQYTMLSLFGAIVALIIALFGYIAWDRRTVIKPLQERLENIEFNLKLDLDLQHKDGSKLTRMLNALRELAKTDEKLAKVLKSFSLM